MSVYCSESDKRVCHFCIWVCDWFATWLYSPESWHRWNVETNTVDFFSRSASTTIVGEDRLYMMVGLERKEPASIFCQRGQLKFIHQSVGVTTTTVILLILISTTTIINVEEFLLSHSSVVSTDSRWRRGCTSDGREMTVRFYYFFMTVRIF